MIEIRITKEISDYEPKLLGPLTLRQSACVAAGAPFCYLIIRYLGPLLTTEVAMFFCFIPAGLAYAFGWAKPYGMKMEQFLRAANTNVRTYMKWLLRTRRRHGWHRKKLHFLRGSANAVRQRSKKLKNNGRVIKYHPAHTVKEENV